MRPTVNDFAQAMEEKLKKNDHKDGWEGCYPEHLFIRLHEEVTELTLATTNDSIMDECCDVANFAMMIWSQCQAGTRDRVRGK